MNALTVRLGLFLALSAGCGRAPSSLPVAAGPSPISWIDGGSDAGTSFDAGSTCGEVRDAIVELAQAANACERTEDCQRLDALLPSNEPDFCERLGVPPPGDAFATLRARWGGLRCGVEYACGFAPGKPVCRERQCVLEDSSSRCDSCPLTIDPQCTRSGQNARNVCFAQECLQDPVAHAGLCATSAACTAVGGRCEAIDPLVALVACPDGTAPWSGDTEVACAGGNLPTTCCVPAATGASPRCTYVAGASFRLDRDPFTCAPALSAQGVCLQPGLQVGCAWSGLSIGVGGSNGDWDASVQLVASTDAGILVLGQRGTATFRCEGTANNVQLERAMPWACTGCLNGDAGCTSCVVQQRAFCQL